MTHEQRARYEAMVAAGESPRLAEVLATRSFPGIRGSSSVFMRGTHAQDSPYDQFRYRAAAAEGVDTNGKRYLAGLARFPNDPEAWVSDLSDVRRVVEGRGWHCEGALDIDAPPAEAAYRPDYDVAPDIVAARVREELAAYDPGDRSEQLEGDLVDRTRAELTGRVDLSPELHVADYDDPFAVPGMDPDDD